MKLPLAHFTLIVAALPILAAETEPGWRADPRHPDMQFRIKCHRESATIQWRNNYPGAVMLKASIRSGTYDGVETVNVAPGGTAETPLETEYCSATAFRIVVGNFVMAPPPPAPPAPASATVPAGPKAPPAAPPPPVLYIPRYQPPQALPTVAREALESIRVGMDRDQVVRALGQPASGITIPDDNELRETLRYSLKDDRFGVIRLSNGVVAEVAIP
jgi:hypothetical protein